MGGKKFIKMDFCDNSCKEWETKKKEQSHKNEWEVKSKYKNHMEGMRNEEKKSNCNNGSLSQILIGHKLIKQNFVKAMNHFARL